MLVLKNLDNPTFTAEFPRKFRHLSLFIHVKNFLVHFLRLSFQIKFTISEILFIRIHGGRHPTPRLFVCLPPLRWGPRDSGPTFRYLFTHTYGQIFLFTELAFSCRSEPLAGLLSRFWRGVIFTGTTVGKIPSFLPGEGFSVRYLLLPDFLIYIQPTNPTTGLSFGTTSSFRPINLFDTQRDSHQSTLFRTAYNICNPPHAN